MRINLSPDQLNIINHRNNQVLSLKESLGHAQEKLDSFILGIITANKLSGAFKDVKIEGSDLIVELPTPPEPIEE